MPSEENKTTSNPSNEVVSDGLSIKWEDTLLPHQGYIEQHFFCYHRNPRLGDYNVMKIPYTSTDRGDFIRLNMKYKYLGT